MSKLRILVGLIFIILATVSFYECFLAYAATELSYTIVVLWLRGSLFALIAYFIFIEQIPRPKQSIN